MEWRIGWGGVGLLFLCCDGWGVEDFVVFDWYWVMVEI